MSTPRPIVVVGPTGTGKSELSLAIAERLGREGRPAEVVNADAMQLYRGMDVGTAKLTVEERRGITHHLLDVLEVTDDAAVAWYQREARRIVARLMADGVTPILVGGSGLYVSSVIFDFAFPGTDPAVRERLERDLSENGAAALFDRLRSLDERVARRIGPHNARRIVRALEVAEITGSPASGMLPEPPTYWTPVTILALEAPRDDLVRRLDERVVQMWDGGLVDEVRGLLAAGLERSSTAGRAIGYAQAASQIAGESTRAEAIAQTQQLTRRYARRQMSWFRRYADAHWLDARDHALVENAVRLVDASGADAARP